MNLCNIYNKSIGRIFSLHELYLLLASVAILTWHIAQYLSLSTTLPVYWHIVLFAVICIITCIRPTSGLGIFIFLLPFLTGFVFHVGPWLHKQIPVGLNIWTMDAGCGFILGLFAHNLFDKVKKNESLDHLIPKQWLWSIAAIQAYFMASAIISISRNLNQTATPWTMKGLLFNALRIQSLGWHDDFYPLRDLMIFSAALLLFLFLVRFFREKNIKDILKILNPLLYGNIIMVGYALIQKLHTLGFYNTIDRGMNSFFPDIHSFGGYQLICIAIGLMGTMKQSKPGYLYPLSFVVACSGLLLGGSRFAFMAFPLLCITIILLLARECSRTIVIRTIIGLALIVIIAGGLFYKSNSGQLFIRSLSSELNLTNSDSINRILGERPELWMSSLTMYGHYPCIGLGLGAFCRSSSIEGFSTAKMFIDYHGENAHNYFIQLLTELGLVGIIILITPFIFFKSVSNEKRTIYSIMLAIGLGNMYGHELLIREFLVILVILLGYLFASGMAFNKFEYLWIKYKNIMALIIKKSIIIILVITFGATCYEVYQSFNKVPFRYASLCGQFPYNITPDNWIPVKCVYPISRKHKKVLFRICVFHPDIISQSVIVKYGQRIRGKYIEARTLEISDNQKHEIKIENQDPSAVGALYFFEINRCFIPKSWGLNMDNRRLGIIIDGVIIDPN